MSHLELKYVKILVNALFNKLLWCKEAEVSKRGKN